MKTPKGLCALALLFLGASLVSNPASCCGFANAPAKAAISQADCCDGQGAECPPSLRNPAAANPGFSITARPAATDDVLATIAPGRPALLPGQFSFAARAADPPVPLRHTPLLI
ncbi:MAG: hypothetical protein ABI610_12910 [Acidobacteriota bacterium]